MRVIVDIKSLLLYLLKYVTKSEGKSLTLAEMIKDFNQKHEDKPETKMGSTHLYKVMNKYMGQRDYS